MYIRRTLYISTHLHHLDCLCQVLCALMTQGVELCTQVVADEDKVDFQVHKMVADVHKVQVARWQGARLRWAWWRAASPSCGD